MIVVLPTPIVVARCANFFNMPSFFVRRQCAFMKTASFNSRLIFSGDTALLIFSILLFLGSIGTVAGLQVAVVQVIGGASLLFSPVFFILSCWEFSKHQRLKRTLFAAIFFLVATCINFGIIIYLMRQPLSRLH